MNGNNPRDNCQREFTYAADHQSITSARMIPVVMDPSMRNSNSWTDRLRMELGRYLFVDMSAGANDDNVRRLIYEIRTRQNM